MSQKRNLTKKKIIEVTLVLADEVGINKVTFPKIAERLGIKYPSLYNHFKNMNNLKIEMTIYILQELNSKLIEGLVGKSGENAIKEFAYIYRDFAFENKTGYSLFMSIPSTENEEINMVAKKTFSIITKILSSYVHDKVYLVHKSRALRSLLHGFISLYSFGYFQGEFDLDDSFNSMVDDFIFSLTKKIRI